MRYDKVVRATFLDRPNRFIADVCIGGEETRVHVKNTGRCRELLVPGATVYLEDLRDARLERKTGYDLIAVEKQCGDGRSLINMDSQAPNRVAEEALREGRLTIPGMGRLVCVRREVTYGASRFDLYAEDEAKKALIEVKGVTLERDGMALFPDAPTERGVKHVRELIRARRDGYEAAIVFVIQMERICSFQPNDETHPQFGEALRQAWAAGVHVLAFSCRVEPDALALGCPVSVRLGGTE